MLTLRERRLIRSSLLTTTSLIFISLIFDYFYGTGIQIIPGSLNIILAGYIFFRVNDGSLKRVFWIYLLVLIIHFSFMAHVYFLDLVFVVPFVFIAMYLNTLYNGWQRIVSIFFMALAILIILFLYKEKVYVLTVDQSEISFTAPMRIFEGMAIVAHTYLFVSYYRNVLPASSENEASPLSISVEVLPPQERVEMNDVFEAIDRRDGSFMHIFINKFPKFSSSLSAINSSIKSSEIELCAMISLNLTTKQMAIATNSTYKSIEAKKYRIRKKLSLSSTENLVLFFNELMK